MFRKSKVIFQYGGRISSMLELGGMPSASSSSSKLIDMSKNNKIRAIALDFDLLTRYVEKRNNDTKNNDKHEKIRLHSNISPDTEKIENVASLLNVKLGSNMKLSKLDNREEDDLGGLEELPSPQVPKPKQKEPASKKLSTFNTDIRSKYASKLRSKIEQGYDISNTNTSTQEKGDAKDLLVVKSIIASSSSSNKWIASTDTGKLLNYISSRSMKIALVPFDYYKDEDEVIYNRMITLQNQLPHVSFSLLLKSHQDTSSADLLEKVLLALEEPAIASLVISDRDSLLRAAKELGFYTCRIRPDTSYPRGNVSTNYVKETVAQVQDVVDDINGISFNSVLAGR